MKEKILSQFLRLTLFAIVVTLFMSVMVFYELFKKQVFDDLKTDAEFARYLINDFSGEDEFDVRVTWIAGDESVLYDNEAGSLENHSDRPEYIEALKTGEGRCVRNSDTLSRRIFYYAMKLEDGSVIRIAKEANSIWTIFMSAIPNHRSVTYPVCDVLFPVKASYKADGEAYRGACKQQRESITCAGVQGADTICWCAEGAA